MKRPKIKITRAEKEWALREGEYWDSHSLADVWEQTKEVDLEVDLERECYLVALEPDLAKLLVQQSQRKGLSPQTLLNLWIQEKLAKVSKK